MPSGITATAPDRRTAVPTAASPGVEELLRRFLQMYWLRPENAMWMTLRSLALQSCDLPGEIVDLGCGDGLFSFLHCGGALHPDFDVFGSTTQPDRDPAVDMFDHVAHEYQPRVQRSPVRTFDVGVDLKPAMLAKAARLGFYTRLIRHDNNAPLPFSDDSFDGVYCNAAYWVREIDAFLRELRRITRAGGTIILHLKLSSMERYTLEPFRGVLGEACLKRLARGRLACWPTVADRATWENRFFAAGLRIHSAEPFATRTHAHVWDIGLRPFAPMLVRLAESVTPATRSAVKKEWIEVCMDLLLPLCGPAVDLFSGADDPAELQYVLTPP